MMITIVEMIDTVTDAIGGMIVGIIVEMIDATTDGMRGMTAIDTGNIDEDGPNGDDGEKPPSLPFHLPIA